MSNSHQLYEERKMWIIYGQMITISHFASKLWKRIITGRCCDIKLSPLFLPHTLKVSESWPFESMENDKLQYCSMKLEAKWNFNALDIPSIFKTSTFKEGDVINQCHEKVTLHKKWSFPLSISSVNVTESLMENFIFYSVK